MLVPLSEQLWAVANDCSVRVVFAYEGNLLCESTTSCFPFPPVWDIGIIVSFIHKSTSRNICEVEP